MQNTIKGSGLLDEAFHNKVLATHPVAYWPLTEPVGATTALSLITTTQNGTYGAGANPGVGTSPHGLPCPFFTGGGAGIDVLTAALTAAFSGSTGSLLTFQRVSGVGEWTDGTERRISNFIADANNFVLHRKSAANNRFDWYYRSNGVQNLRGKTPFSDTAWYSMITTWGGGAVHVYYDGAEDLPSMVPNVWAGVLTVAAIGDADGLGSNPWVGWISDVALWDRALSAAEALQLGAL